MLDWHVFGKISTEFHRGAVTVVFLFLEVVSLKLIALSAIKSSLQIQE